MDLYLNSSNVNAQEVSCRLHAGNIWLKYQLKLFLWFFFSEFQNRGNPLPVQETLGSVAMANKWLPFPFMATQNLGHTRGEATLKGSEQTLLQSLPSTTAAGASDFTTTSAQPTHWWSTFAASHAPTISSTSATSTSCPTLSFSMPSTCSPWSGVDFNDASLRLIVGPIIVII